MVRSHYIPQFILRNFCQDNKITYCDFESKTKELRNVYSVFSQKGYYSDEVENELCDKTEHVFANLFHNKLEDARYTINLQRDELFVIKKYLIVQAIRYKRNFPEETEELRKEFGDAFVVDFENNLKEVLSSEDVSFFESYLRRMMEKYARYESFEKLGKAKDINVPLWAEIKDIFQSYVVFIRAPEGEEFIIPDVGRGVYMGPICYDKISCMMENAYNLPPELFSIMCTLTPRDYSVFPLSKKLAILSMSSFYLILSDKNVLQSMKIPEDDPFILKTLGFGNNNMVSGPEKKPMRGGGAKYIYEVKKASPDDIAHFNSLMIAQAEKNIAFASTDKLLRTKEEAVKYSERDLNFIWK